MQEFGPILAISFPLLVPFSEQLRLVLETSWLIFERSPDSFVFSEFIVHVRSLGLFFSRCRYQSFPFGCSFYFPPSLRTLSLRTLSLRLGLQFELIFSLLFTSLFSSHFSIHLSNFLLYFFLFFVLILLVLILLVLTFLVLTFLVLILSVL